ncbi:MAG: cache domain-containing protein [Rhodothermaceae bacterium]
MKLKLNPETLRARLFLLITVILLFTTFTIIYFVNLETDDAVLKAQESNAMNILTSVKLNVENEYKSIRFYESRLIEIKKEELRNLADLAFSILKTNYVKYKAGQISLKQAKTNAKNDLKKLRYGNGSGYFWINDTGYPIPKMIMHPTENDLDEKILDSPEYNRVIGSNENLFKAFVETCREKGEGFIKYLWTKPTKDGLTEQQPKLSFVKEFKPWTWIIGTGIYIDDIEAEVNNRFQSVLTEIDETLRNIQLGQNGYLFIFTGKREILIHPDLEKAVKDSSYSAQIILKEMMKVAHSDNKIYDYKWTLPTNSDTRLFRKRAFIEHYEPLDWYIVSSVYYNEIENPANELQTQIYLIAAFSLILSFILTLHLSRNITLPLKQLVESAKNLGKDNEAKFNSFEKGSIEVRELSGVLIKQFSSIKQTTAALRKSEDRLNKTLMATKDGIWDINLVTNETYFDPVYYKIGGYTPYEFPPDTDEWKKRVHPDDIDFVMQLVTDHLKGKIELYEAEYRFRTKAGEWIWVVGRGQVIERDKNGKALRFIGTQSDITHRKEVEEKLQKSYELNLRHQETINKIAMNFSLQSENFKETCKIITEAAAKELKVERCSIWILTEGNGTLRCVNVYQLPNETHQEAVPLVANDYPNYFSALKSKKVIDATNALSDPRTSEFCSDYLIPQNIQSLLDASINLEGEMMGVICFESVNKSREWLPDEIAFATRIADQTALAFLNSKRLEAKADLQKSDEELRVANDELQSILYVASHDLRSPLVNITGFSSEMNTIIKEIEEHLSDNYDLKNDKIYEELKEELADSTKLIHLNTTKMEALLKGLLRLSRLGKSALNLRDLDTNDLVNKIVLGMNYQIEQANAVVNADPLPGCYGDETLVGQIFSNLIDNAVKYLNPNKSGLIKIYCSSSTKDYITYCVEDNGIGIKKEYQSKIFEIFHRLNPGSKIDGIGIGLTIIQKMVKKLNGSIHLDSNPGKGSKFYVTLPATSFE